MANEMAVVPAWVTGLTVPLTPEAFKEARASAMVSGKRTAFGSLVTAQAKLQGLKGQAKKAFFRECYYNTEVKATTNDLHAQLVASGCPIVGVGKKKNGGTVVEYAPPDPQVQLMAQIEQIRKESVQNVLNGLVASGKMDAETATASGWVDPSKVVK